MLSSLLLLVSIAYADNGSFSHLVKGETAPFSGMLFDPEGTAHIMSLPEYYENKCRLELEYKVGLLENDYEFKIKSLDQQIVYLQKEKQTIVEQKDSRIEDLEILLEKKNKNDRPYIFAAGVTVGIGLTYAIIKGLEAP